MSRTRTKTSSVTIVLRRGNAPLPNDYIWADHVFFLLERDLTDTVVDLLNETSTVLSNVLAQVGDPIDNLAIIGEGASSTNLSELLCALEPLLDSDCMVRIVGFKLSATILRRLTKLFTAVELDRCHLGRGWWKSDEDSITTSMLFRGCTGAAPRKPTRIGQAAWPKLNDLWVLARDTCPIRGGYMGDEGFSRVLAETYWTSRLKSLLLQVSDPSFILSLPIIPGLKSLGLENITPEHAAWIARHAELADLDLTWPDDIQLPWQVIAGLKKLRGLSVIETNFSDDDLLVMAKGSRLAGITAYYTKLTSASLPVILSMPHLRQFWGSDHMVGPVTGPLPSETKLKEFVALNARTKWFREFFKPYPGVKVVEM